jgi:hypothetical protein
MSLIPSLPTYHRNMQDPICISESPATKYSCRASCKLSIIVEFESKDEAIKWRDEFKAKLEALVPPGGHIYWDTGQDY